MDRTLFYQKVYNTDTETYELDFLWSNMNKFTMEFPPSYYRITNQDIKRPDLISYRFYNTINYWWVICLANNIDSPLEDIALGTVIKIPSKVDIYNFIRKYQIR